MADLEILEPSTSKLYFQQLLQFYCNYFSFFAFIAILVVSLQFSYFYCIFCIFRILLQLLQTSCKPEEHFFPLGSMTLPSQPQLEAPWKISLWTLWIQPKNALNISSAMTLAEEPFWPLKKLKGGETN